MKKPMILAIFIALLTGVTAAAQPTVSNGELRQATLSASLNRAALAQVAGTNDATWVGYAVPAVPGERHMCCWNGASSSCCAGCRLEPGASDTMTFTPSRGGPVPLEGSSVFHVLFRLERGEVTRIRTFSVDCALDAGGLTLHWLTGVRPAESVALLATFVDASAPNRIADGAMSALALHAEPAAVDRLVTAARTGASTRVRGQALFWLAQRAGDKAVGAISDAIASDPETEVKRRAVFALSQLPKDEGVPLLIQVARKNANPAVRKQAIFWLGQSKDPRALTFFEEILFK